MEVGVRSVYRQLTFWSHNSEYSWYRGMKTRRFDITIEESWHENGTPEKVRAHKAHADTVKEHMSWPTIHSTEKYPNACASMSISWTRFTGRKLSGRRAVSADDVVLPWPLLSIATAWYPASAIFGSTQRQEYANSGNSRAISTEFVADDAMVVWTSIQGYGIANPRVLYLCSVQLYHQAVAMDVIYLIGSSYSSS